MDNISLKKKKRRLFPDGHWALTLMVLPGVLLTFIFAYLPMSGLIIAFQNYRPADGIFGSAFVGFDNFRFIFETDRFVRLLRNTVGYNVLFIVSGVIFGVLIALLLDNVRNKIALKTFQSSMFLPHFLSWIVVSYASHAILMPNVPGGGVGLLNSIIMQFGGQPVNFYMEQSSWLPILFSFQVWKTIGFTSLIYYGSILSIDQELYEAASIDGCTYVKRVRYITLPHLKVTISILLLLSIGGIFNSDFGLFWFIPQLQASGHLARTVDVFDTFVFRSITDGNLNFGNTSAVAFLQSVAGFGVVMLANYLVGKFGGRENTLF